jgi:ATP synthase protein I
MMTMAPMDEVDADALDFKPLTAEQAKVFRQQHPSISPWWVVGGQVVVGAVVSLVVWVATQQQSAAWSAGYGALAVVIPAALFARGVTGQFASANPGSAVAVFFVWELVKIGVTIAMLYAAHRLVKDLSWPAMLVGLVVTMKVYWLALAFKRKGLPVQNETLNGKSNGHE